LSERATACLIVLAVLLGAERAAAESVEAEVAFHRGISAYADGRLDEARKAFQIVLADDPRDVEALHYLGLIAQAEGRPQEAIDYYQRLLAVEEDDPRARFDLGSALLEVGQPQDARHAFEYVIELEPENARAWYFAGVAAYRTEQYADSVNYMNRAVELDPALRTEASYYTGLAEAYQGNLTLATSALDVVGQSPQSPLSDSAANMRERLRPRPSARRWNLALTTGAEFDSNPTLVGEDSDDDEESDARFIGRLQASVRAFQAEKAAVRAGYDGYIGVHTDASDVDLQTHVAYLTGGYDLDPFRLNLRYDFAYTWIDLTESFRMLNRVTPTLSLREGQWGMSQAYYQFNRADFDSNGPRVDLSRDGFEHAFGLDQYLFLPNLPVLEYLRAGGGGDFYDADDESEFSYEGFELTGGFGLALPLDAELTALYRYARRNYDGRSSFDDPPPGESADRRDDEIHLVSLDLGVPVGEHWRVSAGGSASFNGSNIDAFDYDRYVAGGYLTYSF
jgi:tetratricopeptide (TPR) repeat protein